MRSASSDDREGYFMCPECGKIFHSVIESPSQQRICIYCGAIVSEDQRTGS